MEPFSEEFLGIPKVIWKGILFLIVCIAIYYGWKRNKDDVWYVINEHIWRRCVGSSKFSHCYIQKNFAIHLNR